jgi:hypothetical protein
LISATWEAEIGVLLFETTPGKNISEIRFPETRWAWCYLLVIPATQEMEVGLQSKAGRRAKAQTYLKNKLKQEELRVCKSGRAPAQQVQSIQFKSQYCQTKK